MRSIKIKQILIQFYLYFWVALIGYIFDFGILILLHEIFNIHYLLSAAISFTVGLVVVYILSNKYVFGESKIKSKSIEFSIFALIGLVGLAILSLIVWTLTDLLSVNYIHSKIIATAFVYLWNFFARQKLYHN